MTNEPEVIDDDAEVIPTPTPTPKPKPKPQPSIDEAFAPVDRRGNQPWRNPSS